MISEYCKDCIMREHCVDCGVITDKRVQELEKVVENQEKIIDLMAGYLSVVRDCPNEDFGANMDCDNRCSNDDDLIKECWKIYFERQVE